MATFKKRGSALVNITIIVVLIGLYVFIALPMIAGECISGKTALKAATARDIALILDSMYAYPYDVTVEYDIDLSDFNVLISNKKVKVNSASMSIDASSPAEYSFVPTDDDPNLPLLVKPGKIILKKENGKLSVTALPAT